MLLGSPDQERGRWHRMIGTEDLVYLVPGHSAGTAEAKATFEILLRPQKKNRHKVTPRIDGEQSLYRCWMSIRGFPRIGIGRLEGFGFARLGLIGRLPRLRLLVAVICVPVDMN